MGWHALIRGTLTMAVLFVTGIRYYQETKFPAMILSGTICYGLLTLLGIGMIIDKARRKSDHV